MYSFYRLINLTAYKRGTNTEPSDYRGVRTAHRRPAVVVDHRQPEHNAVGRNGPAAPESGQSAVDVGETVGDGVDDRRSARKPTQPLWRALSREEGATAHGVVLARCSPSAKSGSSRPSRPSRRQFRAGHTRHVLHERRFARPPQTAHGRAVGWAVQSRPVCDPSTARPSVVCRTAAIRQTAYRNEAASVVDKTCPRLSSVLETSQGRHTVRKTW